MDVNPQFAFGYIQVGCYLTEPGAATGSGSLCLIVLECVESGVSDLHLFDTMLTEEDGDPIAHGTADGSFYTTKPFVDFTITPPNPLPGEVVTFNASACWDPDGGTVDYFDWDFGDTGTGSGMIVTHTYTDYNTPGYDVTLTVTDDDMETWSKTKKLRIWRDVGVVDIWPTDYAWEVTYVDVFHGMIDHYVGIPYMEFIVTSTNFGTVTETFDLTLYMDLDTLVIGDEIVLIDQDGFTLGPVGAQGSATGATCCWSRWTVAYTRSQRSSRAPTTRTQPTTCYRQPFTYTHRPRRAPTAPHCHPATSRSMHKVTRYTSRAGCKTLKIQRRTQTVYGQELHSMY
jgi:hypothetical protein